MSGGNIRVDLWFIQLGMLGEVSTGVVLSISIDIFDSRDMCNHRRGANRAVLPRRLILRASWCPMDITRQLRAIPKLIVERSNLARASIAATKAEGTSSCTGMHHVRRWGGTGSLSVTEERNTDSAGFLEAVSDDRPIRTITYSIVGQYPGTGCPNTNPFSVDSSTGEVALNTRLNHERCKSYDLETRATAPVDDGSLVISCRVTVNVLNINDAPVITDTASRDVQEGKPIGTLVGPPVVATDEDVGQELRYEIIGGNTGGAFAIGSCSGQLTVASELISYEDIQVYTLRVRVTDNHATNPLAHEKDIAVNISWMLMMPHISLGRLRCSESASCRHPLLQCWMVPWGQPIPIPRI